MKQVLVTGGGGFVGLAIVKLLRRLGIVTLVIGRHRYPQVEKLGAISLPGDIRDQDFLATHMAGCDTVFHVAALAGIWGRWQDYFSINVTGTENVIAACGRAGVKNLVYTSTPSVVFDGQGLLGVDETTPYSNNPLCHYARTKIMAEILVLRANTPALQTTALRPHLVWGPGDTNLIPRLLARGRSGKLKIIGAGHNKVDLTYIDNVAQAHLAAVTNLEMSGTAAGEAFFISQDEPVELWPWINELFLQLAIKPVVKQVSFSSAYRLGAVLEKIYGGLRLKGEPPMTRFLAEQLAKSHWFSGQKAKTLLNYKPQVKMAEGLRLMVLWLREQGL